MLWLDAVYFKRYNDAYLENLGFGEGKTPLQVSRMAEIPPRDRLRMLLRSEVLGDRLLYVCECIADRATHRHATHCGSSYVTFEAAKALKAVAKLQALHETVVGERFEQEVAETAWEVAWRAVRTACMVRAKGLNGAKARTAAEAKEKVEYRWQLSLVRRVLKESD